MAKRLKALCFYSLFWIGFFQIARLLFISVQYSEAFRYNFSGLSATFWHGAQLDISTTGYYLLLPVLVAIPNVFFSGSWFRIFIKWYTYALIVFSSVIIVSDSLLYSYWGFRMDYTPMLYLKTPAEAMASVSTIKILLFLLTVIIMATLFIYIYNKLVDRFFNDFERIRYQLPGVLIFMILWAALIIPIRGGFGVAPINAGTVYFSKKMFLNHTAVNAIWNVGTSAFTQKPVKNPYEFTDLLSARAMVDSLTRKNGTSHKILKTSKPDILIIVLESFSNYLIGPLGGDSLVTPNFNRYVNEGILFSNFYASGNRTDKALPAILNGYPAQPAQSIIKEPKKSQSLPGLVKILIEHGYNSSFWYGGEINFANFNSFIIGSGFQSIITEDNFDPSDYNSKWGVHDHILFNALKDSMKIVREPFLNVVLTLSSHEPFDVPAEPVFAANDNMGRYKNSVFYTDKVLGEFLDWAKETVWWNNTLIILVADHCGRISEDMLIYSPELFKIPMLWIGGAVENKGVLIEKRGGQTDIPLTLLNQLGIDCKFPFAKDLLSEESNSFAFYVYNEGFGFITDTSSCVYDHKLKNNVIYDGKEPEYAEKIGKAYLQVLFDDYLKR